MRPLPALRRDLAALRWLPAAAITLAAAVPTAAVVLLARFAGGAAIAPAVAGLFLVLAPTIQSRRAAGVLLFLARAVTGWAAHG